VEVHASFDRRNHLQQDAGHPLNLDGVPDADGVADRHFDNIEVESRALTSSTFSGATSPS